MSGALVKTAKYGLIVVVLLVAGLLAAPFFIDVNSYKSQIEQTVEDATGRHLTIGHIQASLFPWVGVELDNVHLANRSGFAKQDFLSVERLHVKLALMPLLSKQVEIKHFELVTPVVYLERHADGETNWGDLVKSTPAEQGNGAAGNAPEQAPAAPALAALQAESLTLTGGEVTWVDGKAKPVVLSELAVALTDVQLERPVAVKVSGKLSGNAFDLDANVGPVGDLAKLDPLALPVQGHLKAADIRLQPFEKMISGWPEQLGDISKASVGISAQIEQHPDGVRVSDGAFNLNAAHTIALNWKLELPTAESLKINRAALAVDGKDTLEIRGGVQKLTSNPQFKLNLDSQPISRSWLAGFVPALNEMYAEHPSPWKQIKINAAISGNSNRLNIGDLQLLLDQDLLRATGAVAFAGPDIRLKMRAKTLHMDPWLPQGKQQKQAHRFSLIREAVAAAAPAVEPDLRFLKSWIVTSKLEVGTMFLRGMEMGNFSASINGAKGHFNLSPMRFNLAGGNVTEQASVDVAAYPARWKESAHVTDVQAGPLLKALANTDMLTGKMAMETDLRATGLTEAGVGTLNGRGKVMFRDGKLKGFDIAGALRKFTNPTAYKAGPKETDFAQLSGSFKITNGVLDNRDLFLSSPLLRVTGEGIVNLVSKTMDYHVKPRVVGTLKGQGGSLLRKGLTVPLHITGSFEDPKVRPEINAKTLIQNAPALLNKGKLGGGLGGALGGVLGGKKAAPAGKSNPAPATESPQKKLLKGLGGAIPGF